MKKIFLLFIFFLASVVPTFASQVLVENIFSDISSDYQYRDELQALYDRGMIIPDESGEFRPNDYLNRDEFVGISMEVICERCIQPHTDYQFIQEYAGKEVYFDINESNPYFYCIAEADKQNYVRGYDAGEACQNGTSQFGSRPFCPVNKINLEEAVAVLLRNSGIFTISDNQSIIQQIYSGNITETLGNDVTPKDQLGNPYTFYGYIKKGLEYEISEYDAQGNEKVLKLLELDINGNVNPDKFVTKEEFLKMSYIALKSNSCSDVNETGLALTLHILEKSCSVSDIDCQLSNLDDPDDTYDFKPEVEGVCELGIDDPAGYIWRFQNLDTGEQIIRYGSYIDNFTFLTPGEWRVYVRVIDNCGNTSEVYNTIFIDDTLQDPEVDEYIDVDIDVYDDSCTFPGTNCTELEFSDEEPDGDNIFDFDGDVSTSCTVGSIDYEWTFTHIPSNGVYTYNQEYVDNFDFSLSGEWLIVLVATDGCGQTGTEQMTYIVVEDPEVDEYIDVDIDVYDDSCTFPGTNCTELEFSDEEPDGDNIFDFDGDVSTSCTVGNIDYEWTFTHDETGEYYIFSTEYVDNFSFLTPGLWIIVLSVTDGCGQTGVQEMNYIVREGEISLDVSILADPIYGEASLLVDFEAIINGGVGPYSYQWDFGDESSDFGENVTHLYTVEGTYEVTLTVTDAWGNTGTATVIIQVIENADKCLIDTDSDGITDCLDSCPEISGEAINYGCPVFETACDASCGCEAGYTCSIVDPLTCGTGVCLPDTPTQSSCLYTSGGASIFGGAICYSCPCIGYLDFLADIRKCDLLFPAITSPQGEDIYSRGNIWQITN